MARLTALLFLIVPAGAAGSAGPADVLDGWSHGAAPIHMLRSEVPVGRIAADGTIALDLAAPPASKQTAARTFARCEGLEVSGGETVVAPAALFVDLGAGEIYLLQASSPGIAQWNASFGETPLVEGAWLQWIHAGGEARVAGSCTAAIHTASSGDAPAFAERVDYDVRLSPGWNLVRQAIEAVHEEPDGSRHVRLQSVRTVDAVPADMRWFSDRP